ncbi:hypothetical protein AAE026_17230 [Bradyrhizobium sp. DN5]|uniref:hypothetical protein n=1 Tax=Bradyrhizobium sp. DN5 TaxID=3056950 RepID=UPI0035253A4F
MKHATRIYRLDHSKRGDAEQLARMHEMAREAAEVLRRPIPDTFLGRRTFEPFPNEEKRA